MLELHNLETGYGAVNVLQGISLQVRQGQVVALLGTNGAGKSTTLNTISGFLAPTKGRIIFEGKNITGLRPNQIAAKGLIQVPEGREVLKTMTVEENLVLGAHYRRINPTAELDGIFRQFPRLAERRRQKADSLSGGEQQMLAMGRALMGAPKLLMLDEPSMGLAPKFVQIVFNLIDVIRRKGTTVLLVEQNARKAYDVADYIYVLKRGLIISKGKKDDVEQDTHISHAYLGAVNLSRSPECTDTAPKK